MNSRGKGPALPNETLSHPLESSPTGALPPGVRPPRRKVVTRSPHRSVGIMACSWIQESGIEYESQLERRFLQRLLLLPDLKQVTHQPFTLEYLGENGQILTYTPDFLVRLFDDVNIVVEVKPTVFIKKHQHKLNAAKAILTPANLGFFVVTEKEIDKGSAASNAAFLLRYARGNVPPTVQEHCISLVHQSAVPITIAKLSRQANVPMTDLYTLIGQRLLCVGPDLAITPGTSVFLPKKGQARGPVCFCNWFNTTPW